MGACLSDPFFHVRELSIQSVNRRDNTEPKDTASEGCDWGENREKGKS
jgi:hypothetical protein